MVWISFTNCNDTIMLSLPDFFKLWNDILVLPGFICLHSSAPLQLEAIKCSCYCQYNNSSQLLSPNKSIEWNNESLTLIMCNNPLQHEELQPFRASASQVSSQFFNWWSSFDCWRNHYISFFHLCKLVCHWTKFQFYIIFSGFKKSRISY